MLSYAPVFIISLASMHDKHPCSNLVYHISYPQINLTINLLCHNKSLAGFLTHKGNEKTTLCCSSPAHCLSALTNTVRLGHPSESHLPTPFTVHDVQSSPCPPMLR